MKLSKYLDVNRIEFVSTYHCSGRCKHCSVGDRLNTPGPHHVPMQESINALRWLQAHYPIQSVMTFGGEPLLYPEVICALHSTARDCGIPARQVITNGYFSKRPDRIHQVAAALVEAGVNHILLSVDAFHQETIPLGPVLLFAKAVHQIAPEILELQPSWVVNQEHDNPWNTQTRKMLSAFAGLDIPIGPGDAIFLAGNAAKNLAEYYPAPSLDLNDGCGSQPYTEPLDHITSLSIEPSGNVVACTLPIGNLCQESMETIAARYDPYAHECSYALLTGRARALLELAKRQGMDIDLSQCWSVCDLCRQVVRRGNEKGVIS